MQNKTLSFQELMGFLKNVSQWNVCVSQPELLLKKLDKNLVSFSNIIHQGNTVKF